MFQFPGLAPFRVTGHDSSRVAPFGNPRIKVCFDYPRLIADSYVLHRLLVPRHPPYALCNFTKSLFITDMTLDPVRLLGQLKSLPGR